ALALGNISDTFAIRRPGDAGFTGYGTSYAHCIAAVFRRSREDFAAHHEGDLFTVGRKRQLLDIAGQRQMFRLRARGQPAPRNLNFTRIARRYIEFPDAEVSF